MLWMTFDASNWNIEFVEPILVAIPKDSFDCCTTMHREMRYCAGAPPEIVAASSAQLECVTPPFNDAVHDSGRSTHSFPRNGAFGSLRAIWVNSPPPFVSDFAFSDSYFRQTWKFSSTNAIRGGRSTHN